MKTYNIFKTKIGELLIAQENGFISDVTPTLTKGNLDFGILEESEITNEAAKQLIDFFDKKRVDFDLPLKPKGTDFQKQVWQALLEIPYGETRSYKEIAIAIDNPKGVRAVGMANNRNPISFIIPCHRVIGSDGSLVGYGGGMDLKVFLLELESGKPLTKF